MSKAWTDEQKREARFRRFVDTNRELIEALMDKTEFLKAVRGILKIGDGRAHIADIERGRVPMTIDELMKIANFLKVHPFALLWQGRIREADLETVNSFFQKLTVAKIKQMAA